MSRKLKKSKVKTLRNNRLNLSGGGEDELTSDEKAVKAEKAEKEARRMQIAAEIYQQRLSNEQAPDKDKVAVNKANAEYLEAQQKFTIAEQSKQHVENAVNIAQEEHTKNLEYLTSIKDDPNPNVTPNMVTQATAKARESRIKLSSARRASDDLNKLHAILEIKKAAKEAVDATTPEGLAKAEKKKKKNEDLDKLEKKIEEAQLLYDVAQDQLKDNIDITQQFLLVNKTDQADKALKKAISDANAFRKLNKMENKAAAYEAAVAKAAADRAASKAEYIRKVAAAKAEAAAAESIRKAEAASREYDVAESKYKVREKIITDTRDDPKKLKQLGAILESKRVAKEAAYAATPEGLAKAEKAAAEREADRAAAEREVQTPDQVAESIREAMLAYTINDKVSETEVNKKRLETEAVMWREAINTAKYKVSVMKELENKANEERINVTSNVERQSRLGKFVPMTKKPFEQAERATSKREEAERALEALEKSKPVAANVPVAPVAAANTQVPLVAPVAAVPQQQVVGAPPADALAAAAVNTPGAADAPVVAVPPGAANALAAAVNTPVVAVPRASAGTSISLAVANRILSLAVV
jgi:hypothetical protein